MNRKIAPVMGLWLMGLLAACEPFWNTPESRAQAFMETLVTAPDRIERLREIANLPATANPENLVDDLSARVGLDFLHTQQRQGVPLTFARDKPRQTPERRLVPIRVTYLQPGTPRTGEVRFQVQVDKDAQGRWHIARITGDN